MQKCQTINEITVELRWEPKIVVVLTVDEITVQIFFKRRHGTYNLILTFKRILFVVQWTQRQKHEALYKLNTTQPRRETDINFFEFPN